MVVLDQNLRNSFNLWFHGEYKFTQVWSNATNGANTVVQTCINKKNLLIVVRSQNILFGGFTASGFTSNGAHARDAGAFLFKQVGGQWHRSSCPGNAGNDIYCDGNYLGFGSNAALNIRTNGYVCSNGIYQYYFSDGGAVCNQYSSSINCGYQEAEAWIVEPEQRVIDKAMEKWTVTSNDVETWEIPDTWTPQEQGNLKKYLQGFAAENLGSVEIPAINVLLLGPIGAGKSSFINSCASIFKGRASAICAQGTAAKSLTTQLRKYEVGKLPGVAFWDTMGWETDAYIGGEFAFLMDGRLGSGTPLNQPPISPDTTGFKAKPTLADKMHVVAVLMPASDVGVKEHSDRLKNIVALARQRSPPIPVVVIITQLDKLDADIAQEVSAVTKEKPSLMVMKLIKAVAETGVTPMDVYGVVNFYKSYEPKVTNSILIMRALKVVLEHAADYLDNFESFSEGSSSTFSINPPTSYKKGSH